MVLDSEKFTRMELVEVPARGRERVMSITTA
jgi:hypothetical protein